MYIDYIERNDLSRILKNYMWNDGVDSYIKYVHATSLIRLLWTVING